jgi:hypothetical protein
VLQLRERARARENEIHFLINSHSRLLHLGSDASGGGTLRTHQQQQGCGGYHQQ